MTPDFDSAEGRIAHRYADLDGVRLHYVEAGQGPLVVLLHGFPEAWFSWQHQIPALVAAGYRVVAPDMRGYNLSGKPQGVDSYRVDALAGDVAQLIRACGADRAAVAGHDWGAVVAWAFAMRYPELLDRLAILNVPHPVRMTQGLRTLRQIRKSWYMFFFQLPRLPEMSFRARDYAALRRAFRATVRPGAFTAADIQRYVDAAAQPGALTASINYYRALFRRAGQAQAGVRRIDAPVLVIWGEQDAFLGVELAEPGRKWVPNCRVERIPDASHWVQADRPERVNALLTAFLAEGSRG